MKGVFKVPNITYPNQRIINIHRETANSDFLGIKNDNWKAAARDLSAHALKLYMYFAANKNGFQLALSSAAIREEIGMARSTYTDQFNILVNKGYLVNSHGNTYDFYETPQPRPANKQKSSVTSDGYDFENDTVDGQALSTAAKSSAQEVQEINNSVDRDINNSGINTQFVVDGVEIHPPKVKEVVVTVPKAKKEAFTKPKPGDFIF